MHDEPTAVEMLDAVSLFLRDEVVPSLSGARAFHLRVAINAIEMVKRQLHVSPQEADDERQRLRLLLGRDGSLEELTDALAQAISTGRISTDDRSLLDHLWLTTSAKLAVDQPGYAGLARARDLRSATSERC